MAPNPSLPPQRTRFESVQILMAIWQRLPATYKIPIEPAKKKISCTTLHGRRNADILEKSTMSVLFLRYIVRGCKKVFFLYCTGSNRDVKMSVSQPLIGLEQKFGTNLFSSDSAIE